MGPIPLGLSLPLDRHQHAQGAVSLAVEAERAGLDRVCSGELASFDSVAVLAAIAVKTERVQLVSTILSVLARSSSLVAMGAATLADLSGGRYVLGLGAGSAAIGAWHRQEFKAPVATMASRVDEIRTALAGGAVADTGFRMLTGASRGVPVYLAALNPRMLQLAGTVADGVVITFAGPDQVASMAKIVRAAADAAGRPCPDIVANIWVSAGESRERSERRLRETVSSYFAVQTYQRLALAMAGDRDAARVAEVFERSGRSAAADLVPADVIDMLTAPVTESGIRDKVDAFASAGATSVHVIPIRSDSSDDSVYEVIRVLGAVARNPPRDRAE